MKALILFGITLLVALFAGVLLFNPRDQEIAPELVSHGRFKDLHLYRPEVPLREFVLFLSGEQGWDAGMEALARSLSAEGAMVAGISMPQLVAELEADGGDCVLPIGDLENLSHYLQAYARVPSYLTPLLVGVSSGAAMSYAMLAQSPPKTFSGAISLGFCPELRMRKPLCEGAAARPKSGGEGGTELLPVAQLGADWVVLQAEPNAGCPTAVAQRFVEQVAGSGWVALPPNARSGEGSVDAAREPLRLAFAKFAEVPAQAVPAPPGSLSDLPLIEVPAADGAPGRSDRFAILLSGDGGWAGLDKELAAALAARNVPVVGFDSLRYFWAARTPEGLSADLDRTLHYYATHWKKSRALLLGYSQGANVLPFAINRLPERSRALVAQTVLMGLGERASFEFHIGNWVGEDEDGLPILPEALRLEAATTLCLYGEDEDESLCPRIPAGHVNARSLPGGHHFDGAYEELAELILGRNDGS